MEGLGLLECCHDLLTTSLICAENEKLQVFWLEGFEKR